MTFTPNALNIDSVSPLLAYQMFSRNNDRNGNPYRAIVVYNDLGAIVKCYQERSSSNPNIIGVIFKTTSQQGNFLPQLPTRHLSASEYTTMVRDCKDKGILEHVG